MIHADMSFFEITGISLLILFAIIGFIAFAILVFRVMNDEDIEYYEENEYDYHGWENQKMIPVCQERREKRFCEEDAWDFCPEELKRTKET